MVEVPYPGRRERRRQATRDNLLRAALSLISERGIHATRIEDITQLADVAKGAFYLHFSSKSHLVAELLSEGIRALEMSCRDALSHAAPAGERIRLLVRAHADFFHEHRAHSLLFHQARGLQLLGAERSGLVAEIFARYLAALGATAIPETSRDRWSRGDLVRLGAAIVGGVSGYQSYERSAGLEPGANGLLDALSEAIASFAGRDLGSAATDERPRPI